MLEQLSIQQRFRVLLIFTLACFALCACVVYRTLDEIRVNGPIYDRIMQGQDLVADILPPPAYLVESYLTVLQMADSGDPPRRARMLERLRGFQAEYLRRHRHWRAAGLDGPLRQQFLVESHQLALAFYDAALTELAPALERGDSAGGGRVLARLDGIFERQRKVIEQVVVLAHRRNQTDEAAALARIQQMGVVLALAFGFTVSVFVLIFNTVRRSIAEPILDALNTARRVAAGDWHQKILPDARNEAGYLIGAIRDIVRNTQAEIVKSEKLAALGSLVAGVSHELNTPVGNGLMAVSTLSDDLRRFRGQMRDGLKRSTLEDFLQSVELAADIASRNLQRAADLMSSFKQVAADRSSSQRRGFLLDQVVREIQMTLHPLLKRAACEVRNDIPPDLRFDSFPGPLGQVLSNMVENAVKHGVPDGGVITLTARRVDAGTVRISVADSGKGIAPELLGHVFEPFFTTRLGQGGSGLGLHIAHNIVYQVLGGSIALSSQPGRGARFDITLPVSAPRDAVPA